MAEKNPLREGMPQERTAGPIVLVIFGASGDLTKRKLIPAVYNLALSRLLPSSFAVVGVARRPMPDFADQMKQHVNKFSRRKPVDEAVWSELAKGMSYVQGDFEKDPSTFTRLDEELKRIDKERGTKGNRLFYFSVGPADAQKTIPKLREAGLIQPPSDEPNAPQQRIIVEKPFGTDYASARGFNQRLLAHLDESQIYRIDHYLGKETVQNLLVFRFGNTIFEPLWSREHVDHVQITVAEEIGVEGRGSFYESVGITRDIVQNHALQVLTLVAMEPPASWGADAVRDEKVKVLRTLRPIEGAEVFEKTLFARYGAGTVRGDKVPSYQDDIKEEIKQDPEKAKTIDPNHLKAETYVAMSMQLDSWRWGGVPFYLRAGKRLAKRNAEVALHFKSLPHGLFRSSTGMSDEPNTLVVRIQPDEGISLRFATKVPGQGMSLREVAMDFKYGTTFGSSTPEAYERLILDAMRGDATLFTRADEVEAQWKFIDPIIKAWDPKRSDLVTYEAGSWGPREADALLAPGDTWRKP